MTVLEAMEAVISAERELHSECAPDDCEVSAALAALDATKANTTEYKLTITTPKMVLSVLAHSSGEFDPTVMAAWDSLTDDIAERMKAL